MTDTLPGLLERLRSGSASASDRARARALVEGDARLPDDVRRDALADDADTVADATALLGLFGAPLLSGSGLSFAALVDEASADIDVAGAVVGELGLPLVPIAEAVSAEAGEVDVSADVFAALGLERVAVADAVRAEAGEVDVARRVFAELGLSKRPPIVEPAAPMPLPVNDLRGFGWFSKRASWGGLALAAAALFALVIGRSSTPDAIPAEHLVFAQSGDLVIEDLSYAEGVQVVQLEGSEGAVILWVDDGEAG
jgi:hypothetical protein